jgi:hypothetical protein
MSIWILALVLCGLFAVIGFFSGAIRTAMMLLGVMIASFITGPIAPKLTGLMPKIGIKHPLWIQFAPYIIVFSLIALVIFGIGFAIHHKVALIYKYSRDDFSRMKWERMNKHVGISVGLAIAIMLFFVIAQVAFVGGYVTAELSDEGSSANNPVWVKFLSALRSDMQSTGLDKSVAALDKTPPYFYDAADVVALIYHNPSVDMQNRLANYPYFLSLGQRPEFQEAASDKEFNDLLFSKAAFGQIINHPQTQRFIQNQEVIDILKGVDLKDLETYLKTGKSKFDDEKILGRWTLDKDAILTHVRKMQPNIKGNDLVALKMGVERLPEITLLNTLDNKSIVKAEGAPAAAAPAPGAPPAAAPQPPPNRGFGQRGGNRGGQRGGQRPPGAPPGSPGTPPVQPPPVLQVAGEGEWKKNDAGDYEITLSDASGKQQKLAGAISDDELTLSKGQLSLVFVKAQ